MNEKLWVVTCGTADAQILNNEPTADAFCCCSGIYRDRKVALRAMTASKDLYVKELLSDLEEDDSIRQEIEDSMQVYGGEEYEYYEIDYVSSGRSCEYYIRIEEVEVY